MCSAEFVRHFFLHPRLAGFKQEDIIPSQLHASLGAALMALNFIRGSVNGLQDRPSAGAQRASPLTEVLSRPVPVSLLFHFQEPRAVGKKR